MIRLTNREVQEVVNTVVDVLDRKGQVTYTQEENEAYFAELDRKRKNMKIDLSSTPCKPELISSNFLYGLQELKNASN